MKSLIYPLIGVVLLFIPTACEELLPPAPDLSSVVNIHDPSNPNYELPLASITTIETGSNPYYIKINYALVHPESSVEYYLSPLESIPISYDGNEGNFIRYEGLMDQDYTFFIKEIDAFNFQQMGYTEHNITVNSIPDASLYLYPYEIDYTEEEFTLSVYSKAISSASGFSVTIDYDPDILQLNEVSEGEGLSALGTANIIFLPEDSNGNITIDIGILNGSISENTNLIKLVFQRIKNDQTTVSLDNSNSIVRNNSNTNISVSDYQAESIIR